MAVLCGSANKAPMSGESQGCRCGFSPLPLLPDLLTVSFPHLPPSPAWFPWLIPAAPSLMEPSLPHLLVFSMCPFGKTLPCSDPSHLSLNSPAASIGAQPEKIARDTLIPPHTLILTADLRSTHFHLPGHLTKFVAFQPLFALSTRAASAVLGFKPPSPSLQCH